MKKWILFLIFTSLSSQGSELDNYLFGTNEKPHRGGSRTEGVMVIHNGHVIYEKYARGYDKNKKHIVWSVSKTVTALLFGVAIKEGRAKLDQSICDFGTYSNTQFCKIKIQDVLTFSTGIKWLEEYEGAAKPTQSSILAMIYGQGHRDMAEFVKSQPLEKDVAPGEMWRYSSGDTMLAAYILKNIYKNQDLRQVFKEKLFDPIGVKDWTWESDNADTLAGAFYFYISTHGLARIGELLLGKGTYKGRKIFSEDYLKFMQTVPESFKNNRVDHKSRDISGAHLWLNKSKEAGVRKAWPEAPEDTMAALGHWGQYLAIIPSGNLILVRMGDTRDKSVTLTGILQKLMFDLKSPSDNRK